MRDFLKKNNENPQKSSFCIYLILRFLKIKQKNFRKKLCKKFGVLGKSITFAPALKGLRHIA
ncbi:hypothetical protein ACI75Y_11930, partial [Capnocytophaga stomatis]|uniref:hypothetical protein n=1 Tax=Capnocytophaga stomatis TaxID=1848904 RepID=UPI00385AF22F